MSEEIKEVEALETEVAVEIDPEFELLLKIDSVAPETFDDSDHLSELELELAGVEDSGDYETDSEEDDERRKEHLRRKKNDKIFNNSYNTGEGYGADEHSYRSDIRISPSHRESYLHDPEKYKDHLDQSITQDDILALVYSSKEITDIISLDPGKKKYTKQEINFLFGKIKQGLEKGFAKSSFISYIYILDAISSITTIEYKKIFDVLEYEYKESLLMELNQKFKILDQNHKSKKLF